MPVFDDGHAVTGLAQQGRDVSLIDRIVLGDQDGQRPRRRVRRRRGRAGLWRDRGCSVRQRQLEPEG